jgi:hypothetical protein
MLARPRRRARRSGSAIDEIRSGARELVADFQEEIGANLEAARAEFGEMARQQVGHLRKAFQRERRKFLG